MTPFLQFRVWLRRGPAFERTSAAIAAALVLALGVWGLLPVDRPDGAEVVGAAPDGSEAPSGPPDAEGETAASAGGGTPTGDPGASTTGGVSPTPGDATGGTGISSGDSAAGDRSTGDASATTGPPGAGVGGRCAAEGLRASDQGVTPTEVFVAVPIISLAGNFGNQAFGIRSDLAAVANAAAAGVNASGGVACRKLRIKTYQVNPLDQNEPRAKCLEIVADKPFAVIDFGAYLAPVQRRCFVENRLPMQVALAITEKEAASGYPYLYTPSASANRQLRSWVYAAHERGFFRAPGFKKLGVLIDDCNPEIVDELLADLRRVGVGEQQLSVFKPSCTSGGSADQMFQAAVSHQRSGATHVLLAIAQLAATTYVQNADSIGFRPVYGASDYGAVTNSTSEGNWPSSFDGTIALTSTRAGELNSGMDEDPLLQKCKRWYTAAGVPPPEEDGDSALSFCTFFELFKATADAAGPDLRRERLLVDGLPKVGLFRSVAYLDTTFDVARKVTGGDRIRAIRWRRDCRCFKVDETEPRIAR